MFDLTGRAALVTGAGQNVGAGIARALAARGASVVVNDLVGSRAGAVEQQILAAGGRATTAVFDVTDLDAVQGAVSGLGAIDILVNNAGNGGADPMPVAPFRTMDPADWHGPLDVNLYGVLNTTRTVIEGMVERGRGRVITVVSGAGTAGVAIGVSPYAAAKAGAAGFMRALALEVASAGVTANSIALGLMDNVADAGSVEHLARSIPARRLGRPDDAGAACVYLASDEASWMTGQTIGLNGGALTS